MLVHVMKQPGLFATAAFALSASATYGMHKPQPVTLLLGVSP